MISIDKLHNYLNKGETDNEEREYTFKIPTSKITDRHIYGKYIMDGSYSFLGKMVLPVPSWVSLENYFFIKEKANTRNSFTNSILNIIMPEYRYFNVNSRNMFIKDLHIQIAVDMEEKKLYSDMGYSRLRKQIREKFTNNIDLDRDDNLLQIIVDYFSLTVIVIKKTLQEKFGKNREIKKFSFVPNIWKKTDRNEEFLKKNLVVILIEQDNKFFPVIRKNSDGIFDWQEKGMDIVLENLINDSGPKKSKKKIISDEEPVEESVEPSVEEPVEESVEEPVEESVEESVEERKKIVLPKKILLKEIQKIASENGISITKKSEKTGKELKKTIDELRVEIEEKFS